MLSACAEALVYTALDIERPMRKDLPNADKLDEDPDKFRTRFCRCQRLLHFIACRVLGGPERAEAVIDNCWLKASRNPPRFEYEGAFRSWLVRVLIDEALAILHQNQPSIQNEIRLRRNVARARSQLHERRILLMKGTEGEY
jgi:DNA-directed RNA polymerase specialized sigma24 family protein